MYEKPSTLERLSVSFQSSHLKLREGRCDLDYIIALGMVASKQLLVSAFLAAHYGGRNASQKEARKAAITLTQKLNVKRGWKLELKDVLRVASAAMKIYCDPACPRCRNQKFLKVENAPVLSTKPCPKCHGTGRRLYPTRDLRKIGDVVDILCSIEHVAEIAIRQKLRYWD